jgi:hypothetical protein
VERREGKEREESGGRQRGRLDGKEEWIRGEWSRDRREYG